MVSPCLKSRPSDRAADRVEFPGKLLHLLIVTAGGVSVIGGDDQLSINLDGVVGTIPGLSSADLGTLGVKSNGQRAADLNTGSLTGIVDDRLVVLEPESMNIVPARNLGTQRELTSYEP